MKERKGGLGGAARSDAERRIDTGRGMRMAAAGMLALCAGQVAWAQAAPRAGAGYVAADGSIQVVAERGLAPMFEALDQAFARTHPGMKFVVRGGDNYSAMATLTFDTTAFAPMTSEFTRIGLGDNLKISPEPVGIRIAHASLRPGVLLSPLAVIVNASNPLTSFTASDLARVFTIGAAGGDVTRWSQLGVNGEMADRNIALYGPPTGDSFSFDDPQVGEFLGTHPFHNLPLKHEYQAQAHYKDIVARVASDPSAMGIVALNTVTPGVKVVALSERRGAPAMSGTAAEIASGRYPLDRYVYVYLRSNPGLDPFGAEYVRWLLSPEGQQVVAASQEQFVPLNSREVAEELARLEP